MSQENLFSDDPLEEIDDDQLERVTYVDHVAAVLLRVRGQGTASTVIAVIGAWGSGKSSVLRLAQLKLPPEWLMARFDPWGYSDQTAMMFGFFGELSAVLPTGEKGKDAREKVGKVVQLASPLGKLSALVGFDSSPIIEKLGQLIAGGTSSSAALKSAEDALRKLEHPVLMVIDDLDRLEPDELLMVFRLIRSLGRMPNLYYLLSYDEQTLLDVMQRTDLAFNDPRRAQEYLEKMVQVRLDLPPLRETQASTLFEKTLDQVVEQIGMQLADGQRSRILNAYTLALRFRLQTPRAIRRFFAQVDAFLPTVVNDIDFCDFLVLTWLRTFEPGVYKSIQEHRAALTGGDAYERLFQRDHKETWTYWSDLVASTGVPDKDQTRILELLGLLFIPIRSALQNSNYDPSYYDEIAERQGIGHSDYFDRYFAFSVTGDDIANATVTAALSADTETANDASDVAVARLRQRLIDDPFRAGRKITAAVDADPKLAPPAMRIICWAVAELQTSDPAVADSWPMSGLASATLARVPAHQVKSLLSELTEDINGLDFLGHLLAHLTTTRKRAKPEDAAALEWSVSMAQAVRSRLESRIRKEVESNGAISDRVSNLIWSWRFIDQDSCREYCRGLVDRLGLIAVLSALAPRNHGQDGDTIWVAPLRRDSMVTFVGDDYLEGGRPYIGDASDISDWDNARLPDSPEARVNRVMASLKSALLENEMTE